MKDSKFLNDKYVSCHWQSHVLGQRTVQSPTYLSHWPLCCDLQQGINWFQLQCGLLKCQHLFTCKTTRLSYTDHLISSYYRTGLKLHHSLLEVKDSIQCSLVCLSVHYCFPLIQFKIGLLISSFPSLNCFWCHFFEMCFQRDFS